MPDTTTVAIVGLAATAATGIGGPYVSGWLEGKHEERRYRHERLLRDFDGLRELLDDCADTINAYMEALSATETRFMFMRLPDVDSYNEPMGVLADAKRDAHTRNRKLVIRLGRTHTVVAAYGVCLRVLDEDSTFSCTKISEFCLNKPNAWDEFLTGHDAKVRKRQQAHEDFLDAATGLVGSPIEPLKP